MSTPPKPSASLPLFEKLSLGGGEEEEPQQQQVAPKPPRALDFIIVEDGGEQGEKNTGGSTNVDVNVVDDDDALDYSTPTKTTTTTTTLDEKAKAKVSPSPLPSPSTLQGNYHRVQRRHPFRFRYADAALQSALFTAGVKPRLAKKVRFFILIFFISFFFPSFHPSPSFFSSANTHQYRSARPFSRS